MTPEDRVKRHKMVIEAMRDDVAWLKESGFSVHPARVLQPGDTASLVAHLQHSMNMYQYFIEHLGGPNA